MEMQPTNAHRELMNRVRFRTGISDVVSEYAESDYCDSKEYVFVLFIQDCYTQEERNEMKQRLIRCHCCSRHSHYKDVKYKPEDAVPESKVHECNCNCRHYTRMFTRNNLAWFIEKQMVNFYLEID